MTSVHRTRAALVVGALVAAYGCGSSSSNGSDGSSSGPADAGARVACDPAAQTCGAGMKCDFFCDGATLVVGCRVDTGNGQDVGLPCSGTSPCARGGGCLTVAGSTPSCKKYCASDSECTMGTCRPATIGVNCGAGTTSVTLKVCY